jgi:hypothetical protein
VSSLAATISPGAFPLVRNAPVDLDAAKRLVVKLRPNDGVTYKSLTGDLGAYPGDLDWWVAHRAPAYKQVILEAPIPQTRHPRGTPALSRSYTVIKASPDAAWTIYKSQAGSG